MRKNELGDFDLHHLPRPHKKVKKHGAGFSEDVADKRRARVNFKNYLRELEEETGATLEEGTRPLTDADKEDLIVDFQEWSGGFLPSESEESELRTYAFSSAPVELDSQEVFDFLKGLTGVKD
jgi:hypothetical protein